jgi:hypothetical protein
MTYQFTERNHLVKGLDPVADAFSGTVYSDVVSMRNFDHATFIIYTGVGATGTSTITVEACDDFTPSNVSAIPFRYREITSGDTPGILTYSENTGYVTTAGSSKIIAVEVDAEKLAASGYPNVRLKAVESVDNPVLGGILILLSNPKFAAEFATAIA